MGGMVIIHKRAYNYTVLQYWCYIFTCLAVEIHNYVLSSSSSLVGNLECEGEFLKTTKVFVDS